MSTKLLPGKKTQVYAEILRARKLLVSGVVLVIDPSVGSSASQPGWAVYTAGELVTSGVLSIDHKEDRVLRLKEVYRQLRNLSKDYQPDVCVYELVPVSAHGGGRSQVGHASLLMAVGVTLAAVDARAFVGIPPIVWKKRTRPDYVKSDEADAREMGYLVIEIAEEICKQFK